MKGVIMNNSCCTNCGASINRNVCERCGVKNNKIHNFCFYCGSPINEHASICTSCKESVKLKTPLLFSLLDIACVCILVFFAFGALLSLCILATIIFTLGVAVFTKPITKYILLYSHKNKRKRVILFFLRVLLAAFLFLCGCLAINEETEFNYSEEEIIMYGAVIEGHSLLYDAVYSPTTLEIHGIKYNAENNSVYFYFTAENRVGGKITSFAVFNGNSGFFSESETYQSGYLDAATKIDWKDVENFSTKLMASRDISID